MTLKWISGRWMDGWMNHAKYLYCTQGEPALICVKRRVQLVIHNQ